MLSLLLPVDKSADLTNVNVPVGVNVSIGPVSVSIVLRDLKVVVGNEVVELVSANLPVSILVEGLDDAHGCLVDVRAAVRAVDVLVCDLVIFRGCIISWNNFHAVFAAIFIIIGVDASVDITHFLERNHSVTIKIEVVELRLECFWVSGRGVVGEEIGPLLTGDHGVVILINALKSS